MSTAPRTTNPSAISISTKWRFATGNRSMLVKETSALKLFNIALIIFIEYKAYLLWIKKKFISKNISNISQFRKYLESFDGWSSGICLFVRLSGILMSSLSMLPGFSVSDLCGCAVTLERSVFHLL